MIGELLGAGASIIGGLLGSSAEKKAAKENAQIARENMQLQKEFFYRQLDEALRQEKEGKLGTTDARGNRVHYVEGKGWITDLSPVDKLMMMLQDAEQKTQLVQDVPARRAKMYENLDTQRGEGSYADALLEQMHRTQMESPESALGMRNKLSAEALTETMNPMAEMAARNARRTGSQSDAADAVGRIGVQQGDALRKAFMENGAGARQQVQSDYNNQQGQLSNLYNMFQTRATALPNVQYNPMNLEGMTAQQAQGAQSSGARAGAGVVQAAQQPAPQNQYKAPVQYGMANTFASLGQTFGNMDFSNIFGSGSSGGQQYAGNMFPPAPSNDMYKGNTGVL